MYTYIYIYTHIHICTLCYRFPIELRARSHFTKLPSWQQSELFSLSCVKSSRFLAGVGYQSCVKLDSSSCDYIGQSLRGGVSVMWLYGGVEDIQECYVQLQHAKQSAGQEFKTLYRGSVLCSSAAAQYSIGGEPTTLPDNSSGIQVNLGIHYSLPTWAIVDF